MKSGRKIILATSSLCRYGEGQEFCEKVASRIFIYCVKNSSSSLCFRDKCIFAFYPEIKFGHQKWWANNSVENSPVDSAYTPWVKIFMEITLAHYVSEINALLCFMQTFKMAAKSGGKTMRKVTNRLWRCPVYQKILSKSLQLTLFLR